MLDVEKITACYVQDIEIIKDVSLEVKKNAITGVIGPNGAGKSTLLKTIFGFLHPLKGKILYEGYEIQNDSPHKLKQMGIGFLLQSFSTFPLLSVHDNLLLGAWTIRKDPHLIEQRLQEIYELFPRLQERKAVSATNLSGGLLKMLSIAKEIITKPRLLLLDEPSVGLAPNVAGEIYHLLLKIARNGTTILVVDQNIMKALEISDFMYLLEMGQVKQSGTKEDFKKDIRKIIRDSLTAQ
jgi:branched-chain amino acid transport system ATP-binding protein